MRIAWLTGLCLLWCGWGAGTGLAAPAAGSASAPAAPSGPVQIRSDALKVLQKKRTAVFSGNVQTVQGELRIRCKELTVRYASDDAKGAKRDIEQMVFTGDVHILQGERRGHCERADYQRPAGRIVCTGKPWVVEGDNRITGDRIVYLLDADEVRVTRPRAVLQLPEERDAKPRKGP